MNAPLDASESPAAGVTVRRYTPADRAAALALLRHTSAVDDPSNRVFVSDAGDGAVLWRKPAHGIGYLGAVTTARADRRLFYELIRACCQDAISTGLRRAEFTVGDPRLVALIERDFNAAAKVYGRHGDTQKPVSWRFEVDLADALQQLDARLRT